MRAGTINDMEADELTGDVARGVGGRERRETGEGEEEEEQEQDLDELLKNFAGEEGLLASLRHDDDVDSGVYSLHLDFLGFADRQPALAAGLVIDPIGFRDALRDFLSDERSHVCVTAQHGGKDVDFGAQGSVGGIIQRLNIMPDCLPGLQCSTSFSPSSGALMTLNGIVLGIESLRSELFSRVVRCPCESCDGFLPYIHMEAGANNRETAPAIACSLCGRMLLEDVGKRCREPTRYLVLGTTGVAHGGHHQSDGSRLGGGAGTVNRMHLVRLSDSNAMLRGVSLGSRLRIIGVPLIVDAACLSTSLTKMPPGMTHASLDSSNIIVFWMCYLPRAPNNSSTMPQPGSAWSLHPIDAAQCIISSTSSMLVGSTQDAPRLTRRRTVQPSGPYDSPPAPTRPSNNKPSGAMFSLLRSQAASNQIASLEPITDNDMDDAVEQVQRLLELFVPGVPYAKLRLCVLLSFVSGDPVLPLEEATGVRQSIHLLVNSSDSMPVVLHVLNAAKKASRLPCEWVRPQADNAGLIPKFVPDADKKGWRLEMSQLLMANGGVSLFSDIRAIRKAPEVAAMGSLLSSQAIAVGKDQCCASVPCRTAVIALLPSDQAKSAPIPGAWLRSFDLCVDMNEAADSEIDDALCRMVFDSHDAAQSGGAIWENAEEILSASMLASSRLDVHFSAPAHVLLTAFFKATRQAMAHMDSAGGYYQLDTLTRIASAFAKLRQSESIELCDVIMTIDLNEESRAAKGLFSVLSYSVLHNDKPNCSLMHSDRTMAMLKLSDKVFSLCYAYGTLHSDDQAEW